MFNIGIKLPLPKFHACIGISFYTLQAVSYIHDVYKDKVEADTNFARLALYMSFFPIIMEGPICRYADTALPLWEGKKIEYKNFTYGLQRIAYGIMKKVVVADRTNLLVTTIFREFQYCNYDGGIILLSPAVFCKKYFRILATLAHHPRHLVQGLYFLPRDHEQTDEKIDQKLPQKTRQRLRTVARKHHRLFLCVALQRAVARRRLGIYFLRYVSLCAHFIRGIGTAAV